MKRELQRQAYWAASIAVGERTWVEDIGSRIPRRMQLRIEGETSGDARVWHVHDGLASYG